ncbi:MAG: ketopantoate reductase family protein, partial [Clostridiales bacterium]|nr:ketopantoate reductase family protein [Clostridiales bacterium]
MKIGIIGAGAMGCIYGTYLCKHNEVLLVDVVQAHVDAINEKGLEF